MSPIHPGLRAAAHHRAVMFILAMVLTAAASLAATSASACPFCGGVTRTLGEEMDSAATVVLARIVPSESDGGQADAAAGDGSAIPAVQPKTHFRIEKIIKGEDRLGDADEIEVLFFGQPKPEAVYLVMGIDGPSLDWSTPIVLTDDAVPYVSGLLDLPTQGGDRMAFFQEYFEHADPMLAQDAYDEFAKAPYAEVKVLREQMDHDKLVSWINNTEVTASRRRLYLTLLGICGSEDDVPMLEEMIRSDNRDTKTALDALIACYLTLAGNDGMPLVEELFLANQDAEYTDTYAAIMALRFHGQEQHSIDRERLLAAMRLMLDRPTLADLVIPDLARWEDWSVAGRLVTLYQEADTESSWVRVPVIHYLRALDNKIDGYLKELAELDPDAYKRANTYLPIQAAAKPAPAAADAPTTDTAASEETADAPANHSNAAKSTDTSAAAAATSNSADAVADDRPTDAALAAGAATDQTGTDDTKTGGTKTNDTATRQSVDQLAATDTNESAANETAAEAASSSEGASTSDGEQATNELTGEALSARDNDAGGEAHGGSDEMTVGGWASTIVVMPAIGVLLFAVFAVLLLGGRHSSQQS